MGDNIFVGGKIVMREHDAKWSGGGDSEKAPSWWKLKCRWVQEMCEKSEKEQKRQKKVNEREKERENKEEKEKK